MPLEQENIKLVAVDNTELRGTVLRTTSVSRSRQKDTKYNITIRIQQFSFFWLALCIIHILQPVDCTIVSNNIEC